MWGTFLSEPLLIVALVGRYPANKLIRRIPILLLHISSTLDVCCGLHTVLVRLSTGYPVDKGRLDTRYSPVRRSPSLIASYQHAAPRLACVKPAFILSQDQTLHCKVSLFHSSTPYINKEWELLSCSERLSLIQEVFQIELMVRLLLPKWFLTCFLYYYFLFYVNLFKELFLLASILNCLR